MSTPIARRVALAAATTALAVGVTSVTPAVAAEPAPDAAAWLAGQLKDGLLTYTYEYNGQQGTSTDVGLSIDAGLAFAELGRTADLAKVSTAVAAQVNGYVIADEYEFEPPYAFVQQGRYAAQAAKVAVLAQADGANPRAFGGQDLVALLESLTLDSGPSAGRIKSDSSFGDYTNTIGQSLAARALGNAGSAEAAAATSFLLKQQCTPGYFRDALNGDATAANQSCVDGDATTSKASVDSTAYAVLMLTGLKTQTPEVKAAVEKARTWLRSAQAADGSYVSGDGVANANSTGLATWAVGGADCLAAGRSANWLRALQVPATATGGLAADKGAVGLDKAALTAATGGIDVLARGQWLRSTAQAAPALLHTVSPTLTGFTGPTGYVRAGTKATLTADGLTAGDNVCVTLPGEATKAVRAAAASLPLEVTLPTTTATTTYKVAFATGERAVEVSTLAPLSIRPKFKKVVKRGKKQVVRVTGLAPGEQVKVKVGKVVRKGVANANGAFKAKVKIKKKAKRGKVRIKVTGQFADIRRGVVKFKVR